MVWRRYQPGIVRLSITLRHVQPKVARRMDVRVETHLQDLHLYIQAAMGWGNCHLWEFEARRHEETARWCLADDPKLDATLLDVINFLSGKPECIYLYDFGDYWEHRVRIGKIQPERDDRRYPYLVSGTGRCPLEDIGGACGYAEFLRAFDDPDSEYRQYYPEYYEGDVTWDPEDAGLDARKSRLADYVR